MAMASSFDQIGPLAKTVEDAAMVFSAIAGIDPLDQTTTDAPPFVYAKREDLRGLRVGLPKQAWGEGISDEVRDAVTRAVGVFKELGAEIVDVDLPYSDETLAVYYVVMPCEASTNLSRFDGMRYGAREHASNLLETYMETRGENIGREARRRILLGTYALSAGYYDAYYKKAKQVQTLIRNAYADALTRVDVLCTPTAPSVAFKIGEKINDPLSMYLEDLFTVGANVTGLPAVSVPCDVSGLPVGMHLIGRAFDEAGILAAAGAYEQTRTHG
jgi:aspartyl-tRNA(Asn)/glutamyl-tRNA(Gln) amidotransferase subunit A